MELRSLRMRAPCSRGFTNTGFALAVVLPRQWSWLNPDSATYSMDDCPSRMAQCLHATGRHRSAGLAPDDATSVQPARYVVVHEDDSLAGVTIATALRSAPFGFWPASPCFRRLAKLERLS